MDRTASARAWAGSPRGRRLLRIAGYLVLAALVAGAIALAPGLADRLTSGEPSWLAVAALLELCSCASFVLLFRAVFDGASPDLEPGLQTELGAAELGANTLLPAAGAGGTALGMWALRRAGVPGEEIAERSTAFLILQNAAFVIGTALVGGVLLFGISGDRAPLDLVLAPVLVAVALMALVVVAAQRGERAARAPSEGSRIRHWAVALALGARRSLSALRRPAVLICAMGYAAFDFAALWASFRAFGERPSISLLLLGYLVGQGGSVIPIPGGIGAVESGMIAALVALGIDPQGAAVGVLAYRALAIALPALIGAVGYLALRRALRRASDAPAPGAAPPLEAPPGTSDRPGVCASGPTGTGPP